MSIQPRASPRRPASARAWSSGRPPSLPTAAERQEQINLPIDQIDPRGRQGVCASASTSAMGEQRWIAVEGKEISGGMLV
ncbi:MAG: hypothetical protein ABF665_13955 [Gluconacetobacter sp.]